MKRYEIKYPEEILESSTGEFVKFDDVNNEMRGLVRDCNERMQQMSMIHADQEIWLRMYEAYTRTLNAEDSGSDYDWAPTFADNCLEQFKKRFRKDGK